MDQKAYHIKVLRPRKWRFEKLCSVVWLGAPDSSSFMAGRATRGPTIILECAKWAITLLQYHNIKGWKGSHQQKRATRKMVAVHFFFFLNFASTAGILKSVASVYTISINTIDLVHRTQVAGKLFLPIIYFFLTSLNNIFWLFFFKCPPY